MTKDKEFYSFLKKQLNIRPNNLKLYELAFLHRSASLQLPDGNVVNNERLEFLGDAIIDAVIADYLFHKFPGEHEGFLTRMRSKIVNRTHLDAIANQMGLVQVVVAYAANTETLKKRICGDAFEALVGAMYLDKGYEKTHKYLTEYVLAKYVNSDQLAHTETDFKSRLIEWGQKYKLQVAFCTIGEYKDDAKLKYGDARCFSVQVTIADVPIAKGSGPSKKKAEQEASRKALTFLSTSTDFPTDALVQYLGRTKEHQ